VEQQDLCERALIARPRTQSQSSVCVCVALSRTLSLLVKVLMDEALAFLTTFALTSLLQARLLLQWL